MKKLALVLAAFALVACGSNGGSSEPEKTGKAESEANSKGQVATAEVTLQGDKITKITLDETYPDKDSTKKALGPDYNMKGASPIGKEWNEQVEFLEDYIVKNGLDSIKLDEEGVPTNEDVLTGCTISVKDMLDAADPAVKAAK